MQELPIGQLIIVPQQRDAIHIAVAPVIAVVNLRPGQHVGFVEGSADTVGPIAEGLRGVQTRQSIGIVDPYLTVGVNKGDRFWLFLYPQTITSLRHDWTHPAFANRVSEAEAWLRMFAEREHLHYGSLMDAASSFLRTGAYWSTGDNQIYADDMPTFWRHYATVTGEDVGDNADGFFSCAC